MSAPRRLTSASSVETLKREAKRWLRALRAGDADARTRLARAVPDAPDASSAPTLRDVQHALAREHGLSGWTALLEQLAERAHDHAGHVERVAWFIHNACPDHHVRGAPDRLSAWHTAGRLLRRHPELARDSLYTAVTCGDLAEVARLLARDPGLANAKGGPKGWEPILYLAFARLPQPAASDQAVAIATLLLDAGADPNAWFPAGDSRYTPFTGVIAQGEEDGPSHPRARELTELLLSRGAEPYDVQVLYDTHFHGPPIWLLELIHAHALRRGRAADWADPDWPMLDMGGYGTGARYLLENAIKKGDVALVEWLLSHGANPNAAPARDPRWSMRSLYEEAVHRGATEIAELLARHGAMRTEIVRSAEDAFADACFRLDRAAAERMVAEHPEWRRSPRVMRMAAHRDRADVVALLLDLGVSPDVPDPSDGQQRPLHVAASAEALQVMELLIARGAEIDAKETNWGASPIGIASWGRRMRSLERLSQVSRNAWVLAREGYVERLREVLAEDPSRARATYGDGESLLTGLPDDEATAAEITRLLLAHGADPSLRNRKSETAADRAERRGLAEAAALMRAHLRRTAPPVPPAPPRGEHPTERELAYYEERARGLAAVIADGAPATLAQVRQWHPAYATASDDEIRAAAFGLDDARLVYARAHGFATWDDLGAHLRRVAAGAAEEPFLAALEAGKRGDWALVMELLEDHPELARARGTNGNTLLNLACSVIASPMPGPTADTVADGDDVRRLDPVRLLLAAGADPNDGNDRGWTPLHQAGYRNDPPMAALLLSAGARAGAEAHGAGGTPLAAALFWGHREVAEPLAAAGIAPPNLRIAAGLGRADLVRACFDTGGALGAAAREGRGFYRPHSGFPAWRPTDDAQEVLDEALAWAARSGRTGVLPLLVERGARVDADVYRGTPLTWAAWAGHAGTVAWLLDHGAPVNQRGTFGGPDHGRDVTALHIAAQKDRLEIVQLLLARGADATLRDALYHGMPVNWADHGNADRVRRWLRAREREQPPDAARTP